MKNKEFEETMKMYAYGPVTIPKNLYIILKLKLRQFNPIKNIFKSPFNYDYRNMMTSTAEALLTEFTGLYAETHKDEISVLIPKDYTQFNRDGAKLSTLAASTAASAFSLQYGERVQFDVEIYAMFSEDTIYDYFRWRQADACRFAIFSHAVSQLKRAKKISQEKAEKYLKGFSTQQCLQLLENLKFNMNSNTPLWHRRGSGLFWRLYFKSGINPTTNKEHVVTRKQVFVTHRLPARDDYAAFIYRKALFGSEGLSDIETTVN